MVFYMKGCVKLIDDIGQWSETTSEVSGILHERLCETDR